MHDAPRTPTVPELFIGFLTIGVCGFGGVLPWARRMVVEQRRWMTAAEFSDLLGLCQFLPGGNIMNMTIAVGARFQGAAGSAAAFLGLMTAPVAIVITLGAAYAEYGRLAVVRHAFAGLAAAASALVIANGLKIAAPLWGRPVPIGVAMVTFGAVAVLRLPLPVVLPLLAVVSTVLLRHSR
ncbi:MAG: chromate transporter [Acetobacteraceae bacterium]|nr:chromate transporter [Acetobacteraceae bacterium]